MINLSELEKHVNNLSLKQWSSLFDLLPEIKKTKKFGELIEPQLQDSGAYTFPYWKEHEIVLKTFDKLHELELVTAFNWVDWKEGSNILKKEKPDFTSLDIITLCKLLTCIIRLDRFSEGHLVHSFENGTMEKLLTSLQNRVNEKASKTSSRKYKLRNIFKKK